MSMNIRNVQTNISQSQLKEQDLSQIEQKKLAKEAAETEKSIALTLPKDQEEAKKLVSEVTDEMNKMVRIFNRQLDFVVHDESHRIMVKVVDTASGKVLREIPPKEILDLVAKMQETFSIFIDVKA